MFVCQLQTKMSKTVKNTHTLVKSDFEFIQRLIVKRYGIAYSTDYIRKVYKGIRFNDRIMDTAIDYIKAVEASKPIVKKIFSTLFD